MMHEDEYTVLVLIDTVITYKLRKKISEEYAYYSWISQTQILAQQLSNRWVKYCIYISPFYLDIVNSTWQELG